MSRTRWSDTEVVNVWDYQDQEVFHPLTCGGGGGPCSDVKMTVNHSGLHCPDCRRTQDWVHSWIADGSWRRIVTFEQIWPQAPDQGL